MTLWAQLASGAKWQGLGSSLGFVCVPCKLILRPILFLVFMDDLLGSIRSSTVQFASGCMHHVWEFV